MLKIIVIGLIAMVLIVALIAGISNKQHLKSAGIDFKCGKAIASAKLEYQEQRAKQGDRYNYTVNFQTPVGANVQLNTESSDAVGVTSITQKDNKTIIILEPVDK